LNRGLDRNDRLRSRFDLFRLGFHLGIGSGRDRLLRLDHLGFIGRRR
jgi:hypothetical protein